MNSMRGLTLVELMVAMAIGLVLVLAATATLLAGSRGYSTVDSSAQLRQNASFSTSVIQRIASQAGFVDVSYATKTPTADEASAAWPPITGFNNATVTSSGNAPYIRISNHSDKLSVGTWSNGTVGRGSDVLVVRFQPAAKSQDSVKSDGSLFDCSGSALDSAATSRNDVSINVFFVANDGSGEPNLYCYTLNRATSTNPTSRSLFEPSLALVRGVENFQVLYGVQTKSAPKTEFVSEKDTVPHTYFRADQLVVADNPDSDKTRKNWQLVRSLRIGLVLRGDNNKQQEAVEQTLYPLGLAKSSANATPGTAFSSSDDPGTVFSAPVDGRFRVAETFTIHLRNAQGG